MNSSWPILLLLILCAIPFLYYLLCLFAVFRLPRPRPIANFTPPASILVPIKGADRAAYENFSSLCRQDYPEYEILFCVSDPEDPVVPIIEKLIRDFPARSIRLLIGREELGLNDKTNKLSRLAREARHNLLVGADSDIRVPPNYLRSLAAPFEDPKVGAVTVFFRSLTDGSFVSTLESLGLVGDFWPNGLVACLTEGGLKWATGATVAVTRERLAEIGGYEGMVNHHSEDFRIAQGVTSRGYRVEFASEPISMVYPSQSFTSYLRHEALWYLRLRRIRPAGHAGMLFTHGLPWAILGAILSPSATLAAAFLLTYFVLRSLVILAVGGRVLRDPVARRYWWLIPLRDAIFFAVWLASFFIRRVRWRGRDLIIHSGGRLSLPDA